MSRGQVGDDGIPLPPTPWQKKIQTDLVLVIMHILIHSFMHTSWALINITDKVTMLHDLPELTMVVSLLCSGYACWSFCANYPVNGFTVVVFIVILYFVNHCINVTSKSLPFISEGDTFTHHAHVLDILIVAAKFMLDFITIVMREDIR